MAVVLEFKAPNGVTITFHDDAYAGCSPEEIERRRRHASRVWTEIAEENYRRLPPEKRQAYLDKLNHTSPPGGG